MRGRTLAEVHLQRDLDVILLAIRKAAGEMLFNPPLEMKIFDPFRTYPSASRRALVRIAARDRVEARRRQVEAPSTVRDDSDDEMIVSFPEFVFKEFIVAVGMTVSPISTTATPTSIAAGTVVTEVTNTTVTILDLQ